MLYLATNRFMYQRRLIPVLIGVLLLCWMRSSFFTKSVFQSGYSDTAMLANTHVFERLKPDVIEKPYHVINCLNIQLIQLEHSLGHGWRKEGFLGNFNGTKVVVKLGTKNTKMSASCIKKMKHSIKECVVTQTMRYLLKEILLSEQLNHPGLARLLGYCVRHDVTAVDSLNITEHGVVSVFEIGNGSVHDHTTLMSWKEKIERAAEIADFLDYMENSPIGSLLVKDFRADHFLLINNRFKLIDLDDITGFEPRCSSVCSLGIVCHEGFCKGYNAKRNVKMMYRILFLPFLNPEKTQYPPAVGEELSQLFSDLEVGQITAADVQLRLQNMLKTQNAE